MLLYAINEKKKKKKKSFPLILSEIGSKSKIFLC